MAGADVIRMRVRKWILQSLTPVVEPPTEGLLKKRLPRWVALFSLAIITRTTFEIMMKNDFCVGKGMICFFPYD